MNLPHPWTAASALALIRTDSRAQRAYLASYQGAGDAVTVLAQVAATEAAITTDAAADTSADATEEENEFRRLQALAYGRPNDATAATKATDGVELERAVLRLADLTAAEHRRSAAVYAALRRMRTVLAEPAEPAERDERGEPEATVSAESTPLSDPAPEAVADSARPADAEIPARPRLILSATLAAGIVIGCAVGVIGAVGLDFSPAAPTLPSPPPESSNAAAPPFDVLAEVTRPGDPVAADRWFDREQTEADRFDGDILLFGGYLPASASRFAGVTADGWRLWVAESPSQGFCLLAQRDEGTDSAIATSAACASRDDFATTGVHVNLEGSTVAWNGKALVVAIRR